MAGVELQMFVAGFCGVPASVANPRKHDLESTFRTGRSARQAKGVEQRCRAAAAALRVQYPFTEPSALCIGYPVLMQGEG